MWLQYAVNDSGELVYIEQVKRGRTDLHCPYCGGLLTAKKGELVAAHFAHSGETCRQVDRDQDIGLPAYDNFNLHLPGKVIQALHDWDIDRPVSYTLLLHYDLVSRNNFAPMNSWQLTKRGKVPLGQLSMQLFSQFQEPLIMTRHAELERLLTDVHDRQSLEASVASTAFYSDEHVAARARLRNAAGMDIDTALADLRIYRAQWRRVLGLTLYFLDIAGGLYHKIGVTSRPMIERLAEIKADLMPFMGDMPIKVIDTFEHRGNVELYFKHRYAASAAQLGTLTEYFHFDEPKPIITELRRMGSKTLTDFEQVILSGQAADIEHQIKRDQVEAKRRAAVVQGMDRARERGQHVGRPALSDEQLLERYPAVVDALESGLSLRKAAEQTGVAVNTVRKVQQALGMHLDDK